jgi:penicillin-binding protein 1A
MGNSLSNFLSSVRQRITDFAKRPDALKKTLRLALMTLGGIAGVIVVFVLLVYAGVFGKLPGYDELKNIQNPLASEVYSADSVLLGRYYFQERSPVQPEEVPESLKQTLIATEDVRFYKHGGIDVKSLGRVIVKSILLQKESSGGGSTITQQLAKNLFPRKNYAMFSLPINKVREIIIARRLERVYSKDEILVLYLNTIPFGDNTFGIKTAADRFFSTGVDSLTLDQSAVLIGMLKATHRYNPRLFPDRAKERRDVVLGQVAKYGFIDEQEKEKFQQKPIKLKYNNSTHYAGLAPYFRAHLQRELLAWCKTHKRDDGQYYNLYTDGLKIYTTIDSRLQKYAEEAMESQMKILQGRFKGQVGKRNLEQIANQAVKHLPQYQALREEGYSDKEILKRLKEPVNTKVFSWDGVHEREMSFYDSVKYHLQFLQAGFLAMDPQNGNIKAWVGGINHQYFQFDHVRETTKRQVGSTFKPILYAAALEAGIDPCDYISARKTEYADMEWTPENTNEKTYDQKYSMQGGLAGSVNTVSVKLIEKTGVSNAITVARRMGIKSELPPVPSIALGTPSISMMEMVSAYGVFANQGNYNTPNYLSSISDRSGKILEEYKKKEKPARAISKETAQIMVHMMKTVVSEGTGSALRTRYGITNDIAGKTGTTQSNADGWFIGVTPHLVAGAWVGADDPRMHFRSTALGQGAATALPIVAKFFQQANRDKSLTRITRARFQPLPEYLQEKLDCEPSKSGLNFFEKLFKMKKKTKVTKFKKSKRKGVEP